MNNGLLRAPDRDSDPRRLSSGLPVLRHSWVVPVVLGGLSLAFSVLLIHRYPTMFWYDGYSRLIERQHIIIDRWLPVVQTVVFAVGKLTANVTAARLVFAAIAAATVFSGAIFAAKLFEYWTGVIFAALLATSAIFAALAIAPYQEVPFLGLAFAGLVLHERRASARSRWAAVACFNALCLTRYEGWLLVASLTVTEMASDVRRVGMAKRARAAIALGAKYGATAIGWIAFLWSRPQITRPWQPGWNSAHPARHLAVYLYRTAWELSGCQARHHPWSAILLGLALAVLALVGLVPSLLQVERRQRHWTIVGWILAAMALVILMDPYVGANLRETFLPVVFALLYAAEGLRLVAESIATRLLRSSGAARSTGVVSAWATATIGLLATLSTQGALTFIAASSAEPDFRIPAAVGRELARTVALGGPSIRVVTLLDSAMDRGIIALYAQLPLTSVEPVTTDLPEKATHVVAISKADQDLSGPASALQRQLEDGTLPADAIHVDAAVIWTLRAARQGALM